MSLVTRKLTFFCLLLLLCSVAVQADYPVTIIELRHQTVDEMLPLVKPFVGADGSATGMHNKLLIRTSPANLAEIRKIVDRFDETPRQLMIYVAQGNLANRSGQSAQASVQASGEQGSIEIGKTPPYRTRDGIHVRLNRNDALKDANITQQVRATEGRPALIQAGAAIPVTTGYRYPNGGFQTTQTYTNATSGFYVTPRINGDRVTLQISTSRDEPGRQPNIKIQHVSTVVTGRLNEWIPIGGIDSSSSQSGSGILSASERQYNSQKPISLLVEDVSN